MTKKTLLLFLIGLIPIGALFIALTSLSKTSPANYLPSTNPTEEITTETPTESQQTETSPTTTTPDSTPFTASFEIYTNGTKRIFTAAMYHNQSDSVYIQNPDPSVVHVTASGITWNDFFKTLPFSLNKDCLVTGTQQTFCSNETQKLRFFLNGIEDPDALEKEIQANDKLVVQYGSSDY